MIFLGIYVRGAKVHKHQCVPKTRQYLVLQKYGRGQRPFGNFLKVHAFCAVQCIRKGKCMNFSCVNITSKKGFNPMQKFSKSTLGSPLIAVGVKAKLQLCVLFPQAPSPRWPVWVSRTTIANVLHPPDPEQNCNLINSLPKMFWQRCLKK